uniref:sensor histidine kinase n=1 Tax=Actinotalea sp. C106 TaxID=2908644 RepID=UPI002028A9E0
ETGRTALADMRRVLGVLHEDAPPDPQPGSPDLGELVERFRTAGLGVRTAGLTTDLPEDAGFRLAVYRVVQEALTNALRHAPGTRPVELTLQRDEHAVTIEVRDHGPAVPVTEPAATEGSGRGLIGMRERAGVYGGTVEAGPWLGGWRVRVVLPWEGLPGERGTS